jgi:hypothetical protein
LPRQASTAQIPPRRDRQRAVRLAKTVQLQNITSINSMETDMAWLDWLTGSKRTIKPTEIRSDDPPSSHQPQSMDELYVANDDIVDGWQLSVTMSLTTPLKWLLRHQEIANDQSDVPQEFGIWLPKVKSFRELGYDIDEMPASTQSSTIGYIPIDGGDFLPFLIEYRKIVEAKEERQIILDNLNDLEARHLEIASKLGGDLSKSFVVRELLTLSGCGATTADRLYQAGYQSKEKVIQASVEDLTSVKGIGPSTAKKILAGPDKS